MGRLNKKRSRSNDNAYFWPGFVDAMAQLLLVITFLLSVFMVAQFLLARELTGQDTVLVKLRSQIAELTNLLALEKTAKAELELSLGSLSGNLKTARAKTSELQALLEGLTSNKDSKSAALVKLQTKLKGEKEISADALARVELLNQQIAALRRQIGILNDALEASEKRDQKSKVQIADLGKRLNSALAQRVRELARFRSEFFGRLRKILSNRDDVSIVGDRFVFQSEVLFPKGATEINPQGAKELDKLATAIIQLEKEIPSDISWVLRVDGHTDSDPIHTPQIASNWELSSLRAIAVVKQLIAKGVAPNRLVAAGFGQYQPIDTGDSDEAKARNRRIELKLTEK